MTTATERHDLVARTFAKLSSRKTDRVGLVHTEGKGLIAVAVRPEGIERVGRLLDLFVNQATTAGISLDAKQGSANWVVDGETVTFEVVELADKVEHVATDKELAAVAQWNRERDARFKRTGYWSDWGEPKIPKWDDRYQGRLAILLEEVRVRSERNLWGQAIRRKFSDRANRDVANDIPRIVETIAAIAVAKRENREREARERAEALEREQRRLYAERSRVLEEKRVKALDQLIGEQVEAERLAHFLDMLRQTPNRPAHVNALVNWVSARHAAALEQLSMATLEQRLANAKLFEASRDPTSDDRAFSF